MRLVYLVHNLNDPAVAKRVLMLQAGGVETIVAGFLRGSRPPAEIAGARAFPLGQTKDGAFVHRAASALALAAFPASLLRKIGHADVLLARNLEMLAVAVRAAAQFRRRPAVVYEVLDIHRLMLSNSPVAQCLRSAERHLMRDVDLLITSSPGFLREYFEPLQFARRRSDFMLVENKVLGWPQSEDDFVEFEPPSGPPWRIGWLGMIRCQRSLEILSGLARRRPDLLRVSIYGRPTRELSRSLEKDLPGVTFGGAYAPEDLPRLYGAMHFNWAIDYFEADTNSRWLLPNRIYEGGRHNVVPLAVRGTETARWLGGFGIGALMDEPERELERLLEQMTRETYAGLKRASEAAPRSAFVADQEDCNRLRSMLSGALLRHSGAVSAGRRERSVPAPERA